MQKLLSALEMFLRTKVVLLFPGEQTLGNYANDLPASWQEVLLTELPVAEAMEKLWQPILPYLPDSATITEQITQIGLVVSAASSSLIGLLYIFQHRKSDELFSWLGYRPVNPEQLLQFRTRFDLPLPASYQKFCAVHNGLLRDGWISSGPRPLEHLRLFEVDLGKDRQKQPLLAFSGDGAGNEQCYRLQLPVNSNDYWTVDWDHEAEQIGQPSTFWTYLETLLKSEMGIPSR